MGPGAWTPGVVGGGLLCAWALPLGAQDIRWPAPGSFVRVMTVANPPQEFFAAVAQIGLTPSSTLLRRSEDGRLRFASRFAGGTASSFGVYRDAPDHIANIRLDQVSALDVRIGTRSYGRQGLVIGAAAGALAGAAFVNAAADDDTALASDYAVVGAIVAVPFSLLGGLVGLVIRSNIWEPVYESGSR